LKRQKRISRGNETSFERSRRGRKSGNGSGGESVDEEGSCEEDTGGEEEEHNRNGERAYCVIARDLLFGVLLHVSLHSEHFVWSLEGEGYLIFTKVGIQCMYN
jgi:hypothetical protein